MSSASGKPQTQNPSVAQEVPAKATLPPWSCEARAMEEGGATDLNQLFVGDIFLLKCEGEFVEGVTKDAVIVPKKESDAFGLKILNFRTVDQKSFWAEVTGYKPGEFQFDFFQLKSGDDLVPLSGQGFKVNSVKAVQAQVAAVPPNPEDQKPKFFGPFELSLPLWFWIVVVGVGLVLLSAIGAYVYRIVKRKKMLDELARHSTALTPYNEFNKDLRLLMRKYNSKSEDLTGYVDDLDHAFKMYLVRELLVPANDWGIGGTMREVRRRHKKIYEYSGPKIRKLLVELQRAKKFGNKLDFEDCEQLRGMGRSVVDQVFKLKKAGAA